MVNFESSFVSVKAEALQGAKLVNETLSGVEVQRFYEGEKVCSTIKSPYRFTCGVILSSYTDNGYYYYNVRMADGYTRTFRQIDIKEF